MRHGELEHGTDLLVRAVKVRRMLSTQAQRGPSSRRQLCHTTDDYLRDEKIASFLPPALPPDDANVMGEKLHGGTQHVGTPELRGPQARQPAQ